MIIKGAGSHLRKHFKSAYHAPHYAEIAKLADAKMPTEVCFPDDRSDSLCFLSCGIVRQEEAKKLLARVVAKPTDGGMRRYLIQMNKNQIAALRMSVLTTWAIKYGLPMYAFDDHIWKARFVARSFIC